MAYIRAAHLALSSLFNVRRGPPSTPGRHGVWKVSIINTYEILAIKVMPDEEYGRVQHMRTALLLAGQGRPSLPSPRAARSRRNARRRKGRHLHQQMSRRTKGKTNIQSGRQSIVLPPKDAG